MKSTWHNAISNPCLTMSILSGLCLSFLSISVKIFPDPNQKDYRKIPIFAISLARDIIRRDNIRNELRSQKYTIIDACDGKNLSSTERQIANKIISSPEYLKPGQIGCLLSHYKIWKLMIERKIDFSLIVEDDLYVMYPLNELFQTLCSISNFDIIYLGHWFEFKNGTIISEFDQFQLRRSVKPYGTHGYLISLRGAKILIAFLDKNQINVPVDNFLVELFYN